MPFQPQLRNPRRSAAVCCPRPGRHHRPVLVIGLSIDQCGGGVAASVLRVERRRGLDGPRRCAVSRLRGARIFTRFKSRHYYTPEIRRRKTPSSRSFCGTSRPRRGHTSSCAANVTEASCATASNNVPTPGTGSARCGSADQRRWFQEAARGGARQIGTPRWT